MLPFDLGSTKFPMISNFFDTSISTQSLSIYTGTTIIITEAESSNWEEREAESKGVITTDCHESWHCPLSRFWGSETWSQCTCGRNFPFVLQLLALVTTPTLLSMKATTTPISKACQHPYQDSQTRVNYDGLPTSTPWIRKLQQLQRSSSGIASVYLINRCSSHGGTGGIGILHPRCNWRSAMLGPSYRSGVVLDNPPLSSLDFSAVRYVRRTRKVWLKF